MTCFCARKIFFSKKINRLEIVLINSIYNTTKGCIGNEQINFEVINRVGTKRNESFRGWHEIQTQQKLLTLKRVSCFRKQLMSTTVAFININKSDIERLIFESVCMASMNLRATIGFSFSHNSLKLVSSIFYQIFIFHQTMALQKL